MFQKVPHLLATLGMAGGVFIALLFATNEEMFIDRIHAGIAKNVKIQAIADSTEKAAKIQSETEKNWRYYQRFHFHSTGIGAMTMALLLFISRLQAPRRSAGIASYLLSVGGFLYPFVWLFAGIYGPEMGRSEAKEAFAVLGYMGGLFLVGALWTFALGVRYEMREQ